MKEKEFQHFSDQDLLAQYYRTNNNRLLGILLQRYTLLLLGVCMKYLKNEEAAKDAVQQIFLKVINELQRYKVQFFKSWLYMIARNHCLMQLRKQGFKSISDIQENIADEDSPLEMQVEKEKLLSMVNASLIHLNDDQKTCITLFYLEKKSYREISAQTGFSIMHVKSSIQNGKRNLKLMIEKNMRNNNG